MSVLHMQTTFDTRANKSIASLILEYFTDICTSSMFAFIELPSWRYDKFCIIRYLPGVDFSLDEISEMWKLLKDEQIKVPKSAPYLFPN